jgi:hypothetical protein
MMPQRYLTLLDRKVRVDRRIAFVQRQRAANPLLLLRLKSLRLMIEARLKGLPFRRPQYAMAQAMR